MYILEIVIIHQWPSFFSFFFPQIDVDSFKCLGDKALSQAAPFAKDLPFAFRRLRLRAVAEAMAQAPEALAKAVRLSLKNCQTLKRP
jgi:hypothetical protein